MDIAYILEQIPPNSTTDWPLKTLAAHFSSNDTLSTMVSGELSRPIPS
jgi:hypothetical protein